MPRPTYSAEQVSQFYERINLPPKYRHEPSEASTAIARSSAGLEWLAALQRYTLAAVPFENLSLHYSRTKVIDLHPTLLFRKIISQGAGRGGYCMENNTFFATVLRSLGFQIMSTGGRVNAMASPNGDVEERSMYYGFAHMINIVTIEGVRYMVDVGFGVGSSTKPLALEDRKEQLNVRPSQSVRLRYDRIEENESDAKLWIFERRNRDDEEWAPMYCFPDNMEFLPADFMMMNLFTSTSPTAFLTHVILVVKFELSEDGEEVTGEKICWGNRMHRRVEGRKECEVELKSEDERVEALEREFGIQLDEHEQTGILGMVTML
jgi:arylamine N-acetyltransferase